MNLTIEGGCDAMASQILLYTNMAVLLNEEKMKIIMTLGHLKK
jgi:hypothetical protein